MSEPAFRQRLERIVTRARAEDMAGGRFVIAFGPDGPLRPGAAASLASISPRKPKKEA